MNDVIESSSCDAETIRPGAGPHIDYSHRPDLIRNKHRPVDVSFLVVTEDTGRMLYIQAADDGIPVVVELFGADASCGCTTILRRGTCDARTVLEELNRRGDLSDADFERLIAHARSCARLNRNRVKHGLGVVRVPTLSNP